VEPNAYLVAIKSRLAASPAVDSIELVEEFGLPDRGYFCARLTLVNNDFLEVAEYFVAAEGGCQSVRYRYQWMDESKKVLKKRWDNVEHFPDLPGFPHHVHKGAESMVEPARPVSIVELVDLLEQELGC
jgi:hypothetical protein